MQNVKSLVLKKENILFLAYFLTLSGIAVFAPFLNQQLITGPIVNAVLFVSLAILGVEAAVFIGLVPSLVSLATGLSPAVLAPIIPFIMVGNTILIVAFAYLKGRNYWLAMITASFLKFVFLLSSSSLVINLVIKKELASKIVLMMSWPQLLTALGGGIIAYIFLKSIKK